MKLYYNSKCSFEQIGMPRCAQLEMFSSSQVSNTYLGEVMMGGNFTMNESEGSNYWMSLFIPNSAYVFLSLEQILTWTASSSSCSSSTSPSLNVTRRDVDGFWSTGLGGSTKFEVDGMVKLEPELCRLRRLEELASSSSLSASDLMTSSVWKC